MHREASKIYNEDIGQLFRWIESLKYDKVIHQITVDEINRLKNKETLKTMNIKLDAYQTLKTIAPESVEIEAVKEKYDSNANDINDTLILNEVFEDRVNILITEDKKIHKKAKILGIEERVFTINNFLEKVLSENPDLIDYKVLSVQQKYFGDIDISDSFFDTFREDYDGFNGWFKSKSEKIAYVCYYQEKLGAFLYIKTEDESEDYSDITPKLPSKKRLKIGTLKVTLNGVKIGERFLKIIFDNAIKRKVDEIYVTIYDKRPGQQLLINLLCEYGFEQWGTKSTPKGNEMVFVRKLEKGKADMANPRKTFPFISRESTIFIVPILPEYHTELFPDSILNTEDKGDYIDNVPHRNSIRKSYISHSKNKNLKSGDIIVFYRVGETSPKKYSSTATTIGIVEEVHTNIKSFEELKTVSRRRTVLKEKELNDFWNRYDWARPFVVNFLYAHSFPKRPTLGDLLTFGVIKSITNVPRGFVPIDKIAFIKMIKYIYNI